MSALGLQAETSARNTRGRRFIRAQDRGLEMSLKGKRLLILVAGQYEDLELWYPKIRLEEEGAATTVAGMGDRTYQGKRGYPVTVDASVDEVDAADFDALVIPGVFAPDQLRRSEKVLRLTREIYQAGKP